MVLISYTNIIIDQFYHRKRHTQKYIFFLTHWHSDHYQGLTQSWSYGPIYCSKTTKKILLTKYPKLNDIVFEIPLNTKYQIFLNKQKSLSANIYFFDSNHIAGSVMILLQGYFGRVLHTGDMRFNYKMIHANPELYPIINQNYDNCSLPIDEVILDNTYCDPIFIFPSRSKAMDYICEIIDKNKGKRVFIATDTIGKQEVFIVLAKKYQTLIILNQERYKYIQCMNVGLELFTREQSLGWIQVIKKREKDQKIAKYRKSIVITLTGWVNIDGYFTQDNQQYVVPYSLHSNFVQLQQFMKSIYPGSIKPIVNHGKASTKINRIQKFSGYVNTLCHLNQRGLQFFQKQYVKKEKLSNNYKQMRNQGFYILQMLQIIKQEQQQQTKQKKMHNNNELRIQNFWSKNKKYKVQNGQQQQFEQQAQNSFYSS